MLMLKINILSKVFVAHKIPAANKVNGIESGNQLIKKFIKLKIRNLFKF